MGLKGECICSEKCAAWSDMASLDLVQDHWRCRSSDTGDFLCKAGARLYQGGKNAWRYVITFTVRLEIWFNARLDRCERIYDADKIRYNLNLWPRNLFQSHFTPFIQIHSVRGMIYERQIRDRICSWTFIYDGQIYRWTDRQTDARKNH